MQFIISLPTFSHLEFAQGLLGADSTKRTGLLADFKPSRLAALFACQCGLCSFATGTNHWHRWAWTISHSEIKGISSSPLQGIGRRIFLHLTPCAVTEETPNTPKDFTATHRSRMPGKDLNLALQSAAACERFSEQLAQKKNKQIIYVIIYSYIYIFIFIYVILCKLDNPKIQLKPFNNPSSFCSTLQFSTRGSVETFVSFGLEHAFHQAASWEVSTIIFKIHVMSHTHIVI